MSDVVEEFSSLEFVSERLEQWREEDMPAYVDAFAPMCLPKIFSPLVRLQLLFWNPLTVRILTREKFILLFDSSFSDTTPCIQNNFCHLTGA